LFALVNNLQLFDNMLCAAGIMKDIAGLLKSVPTVGDMFGVIDKIGTGNCTPVSYIYTVLLYMS